MKSVYPNENENVKMINLLFKTVNFYSIQVKYSDNSAMCHKFIINCIKVERLVV
jgi:hypothetical protein